MSSSKKFCDSTDLSELNRKEMSSMIIELKTENNLLKEENSLLKTELNEYKNESKKCQPKKRQKPSGSEALDRQTVNKKSFSDRICDDLCEEILQYLSLEDKLKLEGVSKQFQRTVLKKHYELIIYSSNSNRMSKNKDKNLYIENQIIHLNSLKLLLKKFPNIRTIELKKPYLRYDYNPVFQLITKYCNNLRQIEFWENEISDENIEEFQRKFGPKINFIHRLKDANNYNSFPNIQTLNAGFIDPVTKEIIPRLKLNKLTKFELSLGVGEEDMVKTCVDIFPKLRHFQFTFRSKNENAIYKSFEFISNFENLIDFGFSGIVENNKLFCDSLKRMANKCQKLKRFVCNFRITGDNRREDIIQLLSSIKAFPALKRLGLRLYCGYHIFPFESFEGLSNITHLTLYFKSIIPKVSFFNEIVINLPNLQYLAIDDCMYILNLKEVTKTADILSRLSKLKYLRLHVYSNLGERKIKEIYRENCKNLLTSKINKIYRVYD